MNWKISLSLIVASLLLAGCFHLPKSNPSAINTPTVTVSPTIFETEIETTPITGENEEEVTEGGAVADKMEKVDYILNLKNYSFTPNKLTVKAGNTIKVKLVNGQGFHDLTIDDLKVKSKQLKEDEETVVEISAPANAAGKNYEFYCSVGNHRAMGMVGTIEVTK